MLKTIMKILKIEFIAGWVMACLWFALSSVALAGPLEPPSDAVDSSGAPKSTMKTLDDIPGPWDQILDSTNGDPITGCNSDRYTCVMNDIAVRDNETGLVWERSPGETDNVPGITNADKISWLLGLKTCARRTAGGRMGWRLPSVFELASLVDSGNPGGNPDIPAGHPFINVQSSFYWSAMTNANLTTSAWSVNFNSTDVFSGDKTNNDFFVWCVRGGLNHGDVY